MTPNELKIVDDLKRECSRLQVTRRSDREYDLSIEGKFKESKEYLGGVSFSAWLPLFYIRERVTWTSPSIARMTDYPDMVMDGDWSGMRDSDPETIWKVFHHVL